MATNKNIDQFIILTKKQFKTYLGITISVFLFILFFQPFTFEKFEFDNKLLFIAGFGLIILILLFISQIIFQSRLMQAEEEMSENSLHIPLYFFTQVVTTSLAFIFYIRYVGQTHITFDIVVKVIFITMSLPITLYLKNKLDSYQVRLKKLLHESRAMQDKLKQFSENYTNKFIELISENESDNFRLLVSEIVFIKSANNYVEIGYHDEGVVKKKMIRNTLRNVEQQLQEFNNFIRTHRTSIVNIQYINKLNKNFDTYWLSLDNTKESIPVSRQYLMAVKELL
ncbi:MAG: LytTR family transcriptional regulator DNA-binding domain-containing protein [Bacteroidales bacterium]|nr:LytTR family transcriptional regulator DNA-binding domain-containing protein [Bacteroidales bacterium]